MGIREWWGGPVATAADGEQMKIVERGGRPGPALTAAAVEIDLKMPGSWQFFSLGDRRWQFEVWKHYDICGELRFISNWKAQAASRCRLYAAVLDDNGVPGDEADDETVRAVADSILGATPGEKAENVRSMALGLELVGETFVIAFGGGPAKDAKADSWFVASTSEVFRRGDEVMVRAPMKHSEAGGPKALDPDKDVMDRVWQPHPRRYDAADSSVRPALVQLRELEQATKQVFASIDSRLASAGLLLLPQSVDFNTVPGGAPRQADLQTLLMKTMSTALQDPASAAARVPIIAKVPDEAIGKIQLVPFDFPITQQVLDIREKAVTGLARSLDTPPEVLTGTADVSHWSAWAVEESSIKLHIEPLLVRMADALNRGFFQPLLKAAGVRNPEHYTLWFDITQLAIRPNRSDQANQLGEKGLLSDEAVRQANGFEETDKPSDKERLYKLMERVLLAQPLFAADPQFQKVLGLPAGIKNPTAPPALPPGQLPDPTDPNADPEQLIQALENGSVTAEDDGSANVAPAQNTGAMPTNTRTASAALLVAADAAVRRALEVAGGRIVPGPGRDRYPDTPRHELHTRVIPTAEKIPALLAGAWQLLGESVKLALAADGRSLQAAAGTTLALERDLNQYTQALLETGHAHDSELLCGFLVSKGYPV